MDRWPWKLAKCSAVKPLRVRTFTDTFFSMRNRTAAPPHDNTAHMQR
jgi:hypothetical protein